jgi:hypothetical protein
MLAASYWLEFPMPQPRLLLKLPPRPLVRLPRKVPLRVRLKLVLGLEAL